MKKKLLCILAFLNIALISTNAFAKEKVSSLIAAVICKAVDAKYPGQILIQNNNRPAWLECRETAQFSRKKK